MTNPVSRYLVRFVLLAMFGIALVLCMISVSRVVYVHNRLQRGLRYEAAGRPDRILQALPLALVWAADYEPLRAPVTELFRDALTATGTEFPSLRLQALLAAANRKGPIERILHLTNPLALAFYRAYLQERDASTTWDITPLPLEEPAPEESRTPPPLASPHRPLPPTPHAAESVLTEQAAIPPPAPPDDAVWGVIRKAETPVFNPDGSRVAFVPAGSLMDVTRLRTVADGPVVIGSVWSRIGRFPDVMVRQRDVELHYGVRLADTERDTRELFSRRAELTAAMHARRRALEEGAQATHPYHKAYRDALRNLKRIQDEADALKTEFDQATGARRMALHDRLRELKQEQTEQMDRYREAKQKMENGIAAPQPADSASDSEQDPLIRGYRRELEQINMRIRDVGSGDRENRHG